MIKLKLITAELKQRVKNKIEVIKDKDGNIQHVRDDIMGLLSLLAKFDTRLHTLNELKIWTKLRDRLRNAHLKKYDELDLSSDDVKFLISFLSTMKDKDAKDVPLLEYEVQTLVGVLDELSPDTKKEGVDENEDKK